MLEANFWQDKSKSQKIIKEKKLFQDLIDSYNQSNNQLKDLDDLYELALEENNIDIQNEVSQSISNLRLLTKKNEIKCFLSNEADPLDSYIEIHAGAGGTESQDWADMLRRMYIKWSDNKQFKFQVVSGAVNNYANDKTKEALKKNPNKGKLMIDGKEVSKEEYNAHYTQELSGQKFDGYGSRYSEDKTRVVGGF